MPLELLKMLSPDLRAAARVSGAKDRRGVTKPVSRADPLLWRPSFISTSDGMPMSPHPFHEDLGVSRPDDVAEGVGTWLTFLPPIGLPLACLETSFRLHVEYKSMVSSASAVPCADSTLEGSL